MSTSVGGNFRNDYQEKIAQDDRYVQPQALSGQPTSQENQEVARSTRQTSS